MNEAAPGPAFLCRRLWTADVNLLQELSFKVEFGRTKWTGARTQARAAVGFALAAHVSPRAAIPQLEENRDKGLWDPI